MANEQRFTHKVDGPDFRDDYIRSDGLDIFVRHNDKPGKETLLFLHGYPDMWRSWTWQMDHFADRYQVAAMDLRGFHNSSAPARAKDYHIYSILPDISRVIELLQPAGGKVHLVGHDWGGVIAWSFATSQPYREKLKTLSIVNAPHPGMVTDNLKQTMLGRFAEQRSQVLAQVLHSWYIWFFHTPVLPEAAIKTALSIGGTAGWQFMLSRAGIAEGDEMYNWDEKTVESVMINGIELYRNVFKAPRVPKPTQGDLPVRLIFGEKDPFLSPVVYHRHAELSTDFLAIPVDGGHWLQRERPDRVNSLIEEFIGAGTNAKAEPGRRK